MAKKLYIIDGHSHIYAGHYAPMRPLTSPAGEPTKAAYIFTNTILGLLRNKKPDMIVVAMDSKAKSFRNKLYADYKAHRPPMPEELPSQIKRIEQILDALNIPTIRIDGFEADDIIGTLAKKAAAKGDDAFICSNDKDMLQLLGEHVCTYDVKSGKCVDVDSLAADKGISPKQFIDVLALQGDTADNVPGVADVGPKTALGWIQEYGTLENLYANAEKIKGKRGQSLRDSKDIAMLSKELVTIDCEVPIEVDYKSFAVSEPDREKLAEIFSELGFTRLLSQMGLKSTSAAGGVESETSEAGANGGFGGPTSAKTVKHDYQLIDTQTKFDKFLVELKKQKIFAIDTETTSLNAMRAELVGINFCWQVHRAYYLPVKAPLGSGHLDIGMVREKLGPILADEKIKKVGQNIKYDLLILENAKLGVKGVYFDTMVASYCLASERAHNSMDVMAEDFLNYDCISISSLLGKGKNQLTFDMVDTEVACEYAAEDADITLQLYDYLRLKLDDQPQIKKLFEEVEMPLVSVLATMERNGVSLDTALLRKMSISLAEELKTITDKVYEYSGTVFNIDSPKQLAEVLFDHLGLAAIKIGKAGRSTNAAVLEQLADQHPIVEMVLQYRMLRKLQNTYVDKLGSLINPRTDRVHASFNQTVTATGRLSSSNPNLQNIPIRTELGRKIRSAFIPKSKTDCILSADYSQIELRLLAHFSKDKALLEAFVADQDIHTFVASEVYGVSVEEVTSEMRSKAKGVNFGIIYGQGAFGLANSLGITQAEAKKFIEDYFARYSSIREFMDKTIAETKRTGYAETILGRRRKITDLSNRNHHKRALAERLTINTVIQGSAADLIKVAMIDIQKKIETENLPVKMILQIHDELVFEIPNDTVKTHQEWITEKMTSAIELDVPLKVDVAIGPTWLSDK